MNIWTVEDSNIILGFFLQKAIQIVNGHMDKFWVLPVHRNDGPADWRVAFAEGRRQRRRDFGERLDLVEEWDGHDGRLNIGPVLR